MAPLLFLGSSWRDKAAATILRNRRLIGTERPLYTELGGLAVLFACWGEI